MTHRAHPINEEKEAIFYDGCERCDEHAKSVAGWDTSTTVNVYLKAFDVELHDGIYASRNEMRACWMIYSVVQKLKSAGLLATFKDSATR